MKWNRIEVFFNPFWRKNCVGLKTSLHNANAEETYVLRHNLMNFF